MSSLNTDIKSVLSCYVKRKSSGEIKFDEKQIKSGLKLCEQIIHEHPKKGSGVEKLKLITQISHVSDTCETTPIPVPLSQCSLSDVTDSTSHPLKDESVTSSTNDYYLKIVELSHYKAKSKSLETDHRDLLYDCHQTEITTVIGDVSSDQYERVHTATIHHSSCSTLPEQHRAFTRQVLSKDTRTVSSTSSGVSRPSYRSLPSQLNNVLAPSNINDDASTVKQNIKSKKKTKKFKQRIKRLFSTSTTSTQSTQQQHQSQYPVVTARDPGYDLVDMMFEKNQPRMIQNYDGKTHVRSQTTEVDRGQLKPPEHKKKQGDAISAFFTENTPPFRSHSIGAKSSSNARVNTSLTPQGAYKSQTSSLARVHDLQPLAKKKAGVTTTNTWSPAKTGKDIPNFLKSLLNSKRQQRGYKNIPNRVASGNRTSRGVGSPMDDNNNDLVDKDVYGQDGTVVHATIDLIGEDRPVTLLAEIDISQSGEQLQYQVYPSGSDMVDGKDDDNVFNTISGSNRQRSMSGVSFAHFDMIGSMNKQRRPSCPAATVPKCDCKERRINLMVDSLNLIISNNKTESLRNEKKFEFQQIDATTCHYKDCPMLAVISADRTDLMAGLLDNSRSQSLVSLYSIHSCTLCEECDEQLQEHAVQNLLPLMAQLENEEDLHIPLNTIEHFLNATCYEHFEVGLVQVIGSGCTPKNVARLHYLVRRIVKHIGDPTDESNKVIRNILNHTGRFYQKYYLPHIKNFYQSLENFLLSGLENDDVD